MALETLKGVEEIGGFRVAEHYANGESFACTEIDQFVTVNHQDNSILFEIQDGPIKENGNGINGCQVDTLIHAAKVILEGLNEKFPSWYNDQAIMHLETAIIRLEDRTRDREARKVEGTSQA